MSNKYENNNQEDSEDEREFDLEENQNQGGMNANGIIMNPPTSNSISDTIVNEQENTGFGKKVSVDGQSNNPSLNLNGSNGNALINKDNNSDSKYASQRMIRQQNQQSNNPNGANNNNNNYNLFNINNNNNFNNFNNNNINFNNNVNNNNKEFVNNNLNNYPNNINKMIINNHEKNNTMKMINQGQYPFSNIRNPIKILLTKLGETEYLNAILYLIGNIKVLCEYFYIPNKDNNFVKNIQKAPLPFIIHRLFYHLYPEDGKNKPYKPEAIKRYLSELNCVYKSQKKRNPNELFSFILDTLHNELKEQPKGEMKNPNNIFNKNDVIQTGFNNFKNCELSIISNNFNWFEIKETRCNQCNSCMYSFHTYHMLELDILNTSIWIKNNNNNYNKNYSITIYNCLSYYELRKNNLKAYCKSCNKNTNVNCGSKIFSNPNIFVFSLNRGLINGNFDDNLTDISFQLNELIDLGNFVEQNSQIRGQYELKGIVSISRRLKNYVTFCKSPVDNNWYFYDSENVSPTNIKYILSEHDGTKETDYIPCILVYQLV